MRSYNFAPKKMLSLWSLFVIACGFGFVSCSWATPGAKSLIDGNVKRCYSEMLRDSDISHLLIDVASPEKIDHFCGRISALKKCIAKFEDQLTNSENANYLQKTQGISTFYLNVCPPVTDFTEKYKSSAHCFQLIKNKILSCGSDLPDLSSYKMKNDLGARCCALKNHRDCMSGAAATKCGTEAEYVMDEILIRYFRPQLEGCRESHYRNCQKGTPARYPTSRYPTSDDPSARYPTSGGQGNTRPFRVDDDHHSEEDWRRTTAAEEWKKHTSKHNSGAKESISFWTVVSVMVLLLHFG